MQMQHMLPQGVACMSAWGDSAGDNAWKKHSTAEETPDARSEAERDAETATTTGCDWFAWIDDTSTISRTSDSSPLRIRQGLTIWRPCRLFMLWMTQMHRMSMTTGEAATFLLLKDNHMSRRLWSAWLRHWSYLSGSGINHLGVQCAREPEKEGRLREGDDPNCKDMNGAYHAVIFMMMQVSDAMEIRGSTAQESCELLRQKSTETLMQWMMETLGQLSTQTSTQCTCKEYTYTQWVTTGHYRTWTRYIIDGILNDSVVQLWVKDSMLI